MNKEILQELIKDTPKDNKTNRERNRINKKKRVIKYIDSNIDTILKNIVVSINKYSFSASEIKELMLILLGNDKRLFNKLNRAVERIDINKLNDSIKYNKDIRLVSNDINSLYYLISIYLKGSSIDVYNYSHAVILALLRAYNKDNSYKILKALAQHLFSYNDDINNNYEMKYYNMQEYKQKNYSANILIKSHEFKYNYIQFLKELLDRLDVGADKIESLLVHL